MLNTELGHVGAKDGDPGINSPLADPWGTLASDVFWGLHASLHLLCEKHLAQNEIYVDWNSKLL